MSDQQLPPGREPGPQTREARVRWRGAKAFGYPLAVTLLAGGAVLLFIAVRTAVDSPSYAVFKVAISAGCALLCAWLGLLLLGRMLKRPLKSVSLQVEPLEVRRGGSVTARLTATSSKPPRRLLVGLVASEHWEDERGEAPLTRNSVEWERWLEVDVRPGAEHVDLAVPEDGPFSYEGTLVSFSWAVAAAVPRLWLGSRIEKPVWVLP